MKIARSHIIEAIEVANTTNKKRFVFKKYIIWIEKVKNGWNVRYNDRYRKV